MQGKLKIYNTLSRELEEFQPLTPPFVGLYVCGPTVYGYPHLGHARGPIIFDVLHRYLLHLDYKVRYVKNITDVGHLTDDGDQGEDKIAKLARLEKVEPMEIAQMYSDIYYDQMKQMNILRPNIEPRASGHIQEQVEMIEGIIENGFAYEANGSVYFDVLKYAESNNYGKLSGRVLEDLIAGAGNEARKLEGQEEKRSPNDFALWKKAAPEHIMKWNSRWGIGFPGWHIECSAMSSKYLGKQFDIHGGGMDLVFPHHESEIAQSTACNNHAPVKYWMHHNMITINGQKMAKSLNNGVLMHQLFAGEHHLLDKAYSPMTLKFFVLMAHYRGTLDFSNEALQAAEKGFARLMNAVDLLSSLKTSARSSVSVAKLEAKCYDAMNDDINTPIVIANLFDTARIINSINDGKETITAEDLEQLKGWFNTFIFDILGLQKEEKGQSDKLDGVIKMLLEMRNEAKANKDYAQADAIRDKLLALGFQIKDGKEGTTYTVV